MKRLLDTITWGFLVVFFVPCVLIVASWDALPGDPLFGVKLSMERAAVMAFFPSYSSQGNLEIEYTERRFKEAQRLLADKKSSAQGEVYLRQQIITTRDIVLKAPDRTTRRALARQAAAKFKKIEQEIKRQQEITPQAYNQPVVESSESNQGSTGTSDGSGEPESTGPPRNPVVETPTPTIDQCGPDSNLSTEDFLRICGVEEIPDTGAAFIPAATSTPTPTQAVGAADPCGPSSTLTTEQFISQCGSRTMIEGISGLGTPQVTTTPGDIP